MYADANHHIPRRPWSPDEYAATSSFAPPQLLGQHARQREPSDSSVEAVDLVEYAAILRDPVYPPPSSPQTRSYSLNTPSLYDGSSYPSSSTQPSLSSRNPRSSLPTSSRYPPSAFPFPAVVQPPELARQRGILEDRYEFTGLDNDPLVSQFPSFSRKWFHRESSGPAPSRPHGATAGDDDPFSNPYYDRDLLPWRSHPGPSSDPPISPETKAERLRMLEKEFAPVISGRHGRFASESGHPIGSVDEKGRLITGGAKKRIATRVFQLLMVLVAGGASIYAALFIKLPPSSALPPPAKHLATYALYGLSIITLLIFSYFFVLRQCCCTGAREDKASSFTAGGMMMLPVRGFDGGVAKGGKRKKKNKNPNHQAGDVQVNLIVDPRMFSTDHDHEGDRKPSDGSEVDSDDDRSRTIRPPRRRRGVLEGFAMEAAWKVARSRLKSHLAFDIIFTIVWTIEFILILMGPRCSPGQFDGWCNGFNLATAASCFIACLFALSAFFDMKDLHASKISPRSRT